MYKRQKLQNKDLSFIRNYAAGGDAIARGAEQTVNDFLAAHNVEFPIAKGYGMTEASSAATAEMCIRDSLYVLCCF